MRVLIIEDEKPAADKLEILLKRYDPGIEVVGKAQSIKKGLELVHDLDGQYDLIFMDIQLTDGLSFEIIEKAGITKPVIFTTAFNQYALDAFRANGIDYLLKPITFDSLNGSMDKFMTLKNEMEKGASLPDLGQILNKLSGKSYKDRFMVRIGEHIHSLKTDQIALFFADGRDAYLVLFDHKKYIIDYKLETLVDLVDPKDFFRVNRTFIVNINAIRDVLVYSSSRLKITLSIPFDREIIVSREKVNVFKQWYDGTPV